MLLSYPFAAATAALLVQFVLGLVAQVNEHEVMMVREVVRYLIRQGYNPGQLVVLTPYLGQLLELQRELSQDMQVCGSQAGRKRGVGWLGRGRSGWVVGEGIERLGGSEETVGFYR